jgi:hypothetical protein
MHEPILRQAFPLGNGRGQLLLIDTGVDSDGAQNWAQSLLCGVAVGKGQPQSYYRPESAALSKQMRAGRDHPNVALRSAFNGFLRPMPRVGGAP